MVSEDSQLLVATESFLLIVRRHLDGDPPPDCHCPCPLGADEYWTDTTGVSSI